jgi:hypothetical protein
MTFRFDLKLLVIRTKKASHAEFHSMMDMCTNSSNNVLPETHYGFEIERHC